MSSDDREKQTARDLALAPLDNERRRELLAWAADNAIAANDPVWTYFIAAGLLQHWHQQQIDSTETAIAHLRAQHKVSIEQLQAATIAAVAAADAELTQHKKNISAAVMDATEKVTTKSSAAAENAIRELAVAGARKIGWAWLIPPGVVMAILVGVGWGGWQLYSSDLRLLKSEIASARSNLSELRRLSGGIEISSCSGHPCARIDKELTKQLGRHGKGSDFFMLKLKGDE
jgi:hypothetical protein